MVIPSADAMAETESQIVSSGRALDQASPAGMLFHHQQNDHDPR
jgi:hypothetical protein